MHKNHRYLIVLLVGLLISACGNINKTTPESNKNQWVFISIESIMSRDTSDYFYYGQISDVTMEKLQDKDPSGYFVLSNLRFLNDSDKLEIYEDEENVGSRIFKIKDIQRVELIKGDPIYTYDKTDLDKNAISYIKTHKNKLSPIK